MREKLFIYQMMPRLFSNRNGTNRHNGSLAENGCGKFNDLSHSLLRNLRIDGYTHIWYIGIPAHASATDYTAYGIPKQFPEIIKGKAGSPYAIRDYYDVDPDLAEDVSRRMEEFEALVDRTHQAGLKVITTSYPTMWHATIARWQNPQVSRILVMMTTTQLLSPQNNFTIYPESH